MRRGPSSVRLELEESPDIAGDNSRRSHIQKELMRLADHLGVRTLRRNASVHSSTVLSRAALLAAAVCAVLLVSAIVFVETPPPPDDGFFFLSLGDYGSGNRKQLKVARQLARMATKYGAEFIISLGDNFYPSGIKDLNDPLISKYYEKVYKQPGLQRVPWYLVLGDHDHRGNVSAQMEYSQVSPRWNMPALYYQRTVEIGQGATLDIFFIDSISLEGYFAGNNQTDRRFAEDYNPEFSGPEVGKAQMQWLDSALANSTATWKMVVGHRPIRSCSVRYDRYPVEFVVRENLQALLIKHGVTAHASKTLAERNSLSWGPPRNPTDGGSADEGSRSATWCFSVVLGDIRKKQRKTWASTLGEVWRMVLAELWVPWLGAQATHLGAEPRVGEANIGYAESGEG